MKDADIEIPINLANFISIAISNVGAKHVFNTLTLFTKPIHSFSLNDVITPTTKGDERIEIGFVLEYVQKNWTKIKQDALDEAYHQRAIETKK